MRKIILSLSLLSFFISGFAQIQNEDLSGGIVFEGEPGLIANPGNRRQMVVAWMGYQLGSLVVIKTRATTDGGITWSAVQARPHFKPGFTSADVNLAWDQNNNLYMTYVDFQKPDSGGIWLDKSTDGGMSWNRISRIWNANEDAEIPLDRPWIACEKTSGKLLLTTMSANWDPLPNRPFFKRSEDGGNTWTAFRYADTTNFLVGNAIAAAMPFPAIGADDAWYKVYASYVPSQNIYPQYILSKSTDSGLNWTYSTLHAGLNGTGDTLHKSGYRLVAHPSDPNKLAFCSLTYINGDADLVVFHSENAGASWAGPVRVNDDALSNGKSQDLAWITYSPTGKLVATWRDRRNASGSGYRQPSEIYCSVSSDNGATWSTNFALSSQVVQYDSILDQSGNDFMSCVADSDSVSAVWGDTRSGVLNIYFSKASLSGGTASVQELASEKPFPATVFPNPVSDDLHIRLNEKESGMVSALIFDAEGRQVLEHECKMKRGVCEWTNLNLPPGAYYIRLVAGNTLYGARFIKE